MFDDNMNSSLSFDELRELLEACGIGMSDDEFQAVTEAMDENGDGEISMGEFQNFVHNRSNAQTEVGSDENRNTSFDDETDGSGDIEQDSNNACGTEMSCIGVGAGCMGAGVGESVFSDELEDEIFDESEDKKRRQQSPAREEPRRKMERSASYSPSFALRRYAADMLKQAADPFLVLLLDGYDPSDDDLEEDRKVQFISSAMWSGIEIGGDREPIHLNQTTLVSLAGGNLPVGNVRITHCTVQIRSVTGLLSSLIFGGVLQESLTIRVEGLELDLLPFPDVARKREVQAMLDQFRAAFEEVKRKLTGLLSMGGSAEAVEDKKDPDPKEPAATAYGPLAQLADGLELTVDKFSIHVRLAPPGHVCFSE